MNAHEDAARQRKANALADMLDAFGIDPAWAKDAPAVVRLDVATAAGVKLPSDATWSMACDLLTHRLSVRASLVGTDPFEGLPS